MTDYEINRWDGGGTNIRKLPIIYITPDKTLLSALRVNNFFVMCKIKNTNSIYDGKSIPGVVIPSGEYPNPRPNFFHDTGLYTVQLVFDWHGYPQKNGSVSFSVINETPEPENKEESDDEPENKEESTKSFTTAQLIIAIEVLFLFGFFVMMRF